jgi:hypothetical protein
MGQMARWVRLEETAVTGIARVPNADGRYNLREVANADPP